MHAAFSNLKLNFDKTIIVPLGTDDIQLAKGMLEGACPIAVRCTVELQAKYLGIRLGPAATVNRQWAYCLLKFEKRARLYMGLSPGLNYACRCFNVFVHSLLMFIAQFCILPDGILSLERKAIGKFCLREKSGFANFVFYSENVQN